MILKKKIINSLFAAVFLLNLSGCSRSFSAQAVNEMRFNLDTISDVTISYDEENITFFQSDNDELIIKEYMSKSKSSYNADVKQGSASIHISEGGKPFLKGNFTRYIEVYFPEKYHENLIVSTTNGKIEMSDMVFHLNSFCIDSTAGTIQINDANASIIHLTSTSGKLDLGKITGKQIKINTTSATVDCAQLNGAVSYISTSGNINVKSAAGSGTYQVNNSGKLKVTYIEVTDDLSFFNKNENIELTLPHNLEFDFEAATKNGSVSTSFQDCISVDGQSIHGIVGSAPTVKVKTETKNGNIEVLQ